VFDEMKMGWVQAGAKAVAYYRCSVNDFDQQAILRQQDCVRKWAAANEVEIIREFCDLGPERTASGDQPAFTEMVKDWITQRSDFDRVLCFDLTRLGRGGGEGNASFAAVCEQHGKQVVVVNAA